MRTGAAFSVNDGRSGFPAAYLETPPHGVALRVRDGRLWVRNPFVDPRYLGRDEAFATADGFVDTGDAVRIDGDRVMFQGRSNGCISLDYR